MNDIAANIKAIQDHITQQAFAAKRNAEDIKLVAVSKKQPLKRVQAALDAGHRVFGENRVQEAQERWGELRTQYDDLELHLIGPLQSNKAADAVALFDWIETVDREKIAKALANEMLDQGRDLPCLIQVNIGGEAQKYGILPAQIGEFYHYCRYSCGLDIRGLMCIPPIDEPAGLHFAMMKKLAEEAEFSELSMGMSADYEKAVPLGATIIRVGSAIFGERPSEN